MRILIIDDNQEITENISLYLRSKGFDTDIAPNGSQAFDMIQRKEFDFLIVDRMMPEIDGLALIRMLQSRHIHIPFLFLTALGKQIDRIEWLSLGADDYLVKPFDLQELFLRIQNIARRKWTEPIFSKNTFEFSGIRVDQTSRLVTRNEMVIELSPKEYELLEILIKNKGKILDRDFLYEKVWWDRDVSEKVLETINVHIAHLRRKLSPELIRTVKLVWYIID